MSGATRPNKLILGWKYRNELPESWRESNILQVNYDNDTDLAKDGVQNEGEVWSIPFDPAVEIVDIFAVSVSRSGKRRAIKLEDWPGNTLLKEGGGINATEKEFDVLKPTGPAGDFFVGSIFRIDDEFFTINNIAPGSPNDTWKVKRAQHGTAGAAHALDAVVRKIAFNVGHRGIGLSSVPDNAKADSAQFFVLRDSADDLGNGIDFEFARPLANTKSLINYEIQLKTSPIWADTVADHTGLRGIQHQGTDGDVTANEKTLRTSDTLNVAWAGLTLYTYEDINLTTGEIGHPRAFTIDTVVDNGDGTWTITVAGDESFSLSTGTEKDDLFFVVADGFQRAPNELVSWIRGPDISSFIPPANPGIQTYTQFFKTSETVFARLRWISFFGTTPWMYWDGATGSTTKGAATTFTPTAMQSGAFGGTIGASQLTENAQGFNADMVFTAIDHERVQWTSGTIRFADGSSFSIIPGLTGVMPGKTWIYLDPDVSSTVLQVTSNRDTAVGDRIQIMAVALPVTANVNEGTHDGPFNVRYLKDSLVDFVLLGVKVGDVVQNITDGSEGTVSSIETTTNPNDTLLLNLRDFPLEGLKRDFPLKSKGRSSPLTALTALTGGTGNDFDTGDTYNIKDGNTKAFFFQVFGTLGINADNIAAGSIRAGHIAANVVTAIEINVLKLDAITADVGELTAGVITGILYRTAADGRRIELSSSFTNEIRFFNFDGDFMAVIRTVGNTYQLLMQSGMDNIVYSTADVSAIFGVNAGTGGTNFQCRQGETEFFKDIDMSSEEILDCLRIFTAIIEGQGGDTGIQCRTFLDMDFNVITDCDEIRVEALTFPQGPGDIGFFDDIDMFTRSIDNCNQLNVLRCHVESRLEIEEVSPDAPNQLNAATVFAKDNGSGKTQLMVRFGSGSAIQLAIEV